MHVRFGNEESLFEACFPGTLRSGGPTASRRLRAAGNLGAKMKDSEMNLGFAGLGAVINAQGGGFSMKRISTLFEIILCATLLVLGLYLLYEGTSNKSGSEAAILIGGAVCFTLSVMTLIFAVRSILWHRRMLRHSSHYLDSADPGHNRG
jgi:hypothetical protein